jgi:hypothetical protein
MGLDTPSKVEVKLLLSIPANHSEKFQLEPAHCRSLKIREPTFLHHQQQTVVHCIDFGLAQFNRSNL